MSKVTPKRMYYYLKQHKKPILMGLKFIEFLVKIFL